MESKSRTSTKPFHKLIVDFFIFLVVIIVGDVLYISLAFLGLASGNPHGAAASKLICSCVLDGIFQDAIYFIKERFEWLKKFRSVMGKDLRLVTDSLINPMINFNCFN